MAFFDLCVNLSEDSTQDWNVILARLYEMGYKTVAINKIISESIFEKDKKRKKKNEEKESEAPTSLVPEPMNVDDLFKEFNGKMRILTRITFVCSDPSKTYPLAYCQNIKKYNLYSIVPKTQAALQYACSQLHADLISIDATTHGLKLSKKLYLQAVKRGLYFEICYTDFLKCDTRKLAIHLSHLFHIYGKSKNIIVSSAASNSTAIRNPYDIINLGSILGLNEVKSKGSVLSECKNVLLKAERRRHGKAVFGVEFLTESHIMNDSENECTNVKKMKL